MLTRVATGPEATKALDALRAVEARRDAWPFPWVYPTEGTIRRNPMGFIASPAIGLANQATILTFGVPSGYIFELQGLLIGAYTTGMIGVGSPGDFSFSLDKNTPLGGGALQGSPLADLSVIPFNLGSLITGPMPLPRSETFAPTDIIRAKVINNSGGVGAPVFCCAMFAGWLYKAIGK